MTAQAKHLDAKQGGTQNKTEPQAKSTGFHSADNAYKANKAKAKAKHASNYASARTGQKSKNNRESGEHGIDRFSHFGVSCSYIKIITKNIVIGINMLVVLIRNVHIIPLEIQKWNCCEVIIAYKMAFVNTFFPKKEKYFQKPLYKMEKSCYNNTVNGKRRAIWSLILIELN